MAHIEQEHFFFAARDGRPCRLFVPTEVWEYEEHLYGGHLSNWLAAELGSVGEELEDFDLDQLATELEHSLQAARPEYEEVRRLTGLVETHGVGQPARLLRMNVPPDRDELVPGLIARGGVTLIGGREKLSGKSTLLFYLLGRLERNEDTLFGEAYGAAVKTLVLTEEPQYAIRDKCERYDLNDTWIVEDWVWPLDKFPGSTSQRKWEAKLDSVEVLARALDADHVVIDPFSRVAQIEDEAGREMGARAEAVSALAYRTGLAVTLIHHNNKREDAAVENRMRGSTSLSAAVEQIVQIDRQEKSKHKKYPRQRAMWSIGRVREADWERVIELSEDAKTYVEVDVAEKAAERALETALAKDLERTNKLQEHVQELTDLFGPQFDFTVADVEEHVEGWGKRRTIKTRLDELVAEDLLQAVGAGKGLETKYRLP